MKSFENLKVYCAAREFRKAISILCKELPVKEKYRLCDQLIRSSRSITTQIAEGFGRYHHQENIQFCRIARGSLTEVHDHLNIALDEKFIDVKVHRKLLNEKENIARLLNGYIRYLKEAKNKNTDNR